MGGRVGTDHELCSCYACSINYLREGRGRSAGRGVRGGVEGGMGKQRGEQLWAQIQAQGAVTWTLPGGTPAVLLALAHLGFGLFCSVFLVGHGAFFQIQGLTVMASHPTSLLSPGWPGMQGASSPRHRSASSLSAWCTQQCPHWSRCGGLAGGRNHSGQPPAPRLPKKNTPAVLPIHLASHLRVN